MSAVITWIFVILLAIFCFICIKAKKKTSCDYRVRGNSPTRKPASKRAYEAKVLAKCNGGLIIRRSQDDALRYIPEQHVANAKVDDKLKCNDWPSPDGTYACPIVDMPLYIATHNREGAKLAEVVRRLSENYVLCHFKDEDILVKCSPEKQQKKQTTISKVVGLHGGDTNRALVCKDVACLPVLPAHDGLMLVLAEPYTE